MNVSYVRKLTERHLHTFMSVTQGPNGRSNDKAMQRLIFRTANTPSAKGKINGQSIVSSDTLCLRLYTCRGVSLYVTGTCSVRFGPDSFAVLHSGLYMIP